MEATWVGGPWDGQAVELPSHTHEVAVAVGRPPRLLAGCNTGFREVTLPVVHTSQGVRIYWHEPA